MSKKRAIKRRAKKSGRPLQLRHSSYMITNEPVEDESVKGLPPEVRERIEVLYNLLRKEPAEAIPELLDLKERYPDVPVFYNHLSVAYQLLDKPEEAEAVILENYQRHPDYLFAKLNYAELCREKGELDKIPEIFENKFDLGMLYPERDTFHVSGFVGFAGTVGMYFCEVGKLEPAEIYHQALSKVAPDHPTTELLGNRLMLSGLEQALKNLTER